MPGTAFSWQNLEGWREGAQRAVEAKFPLIYPGAGLKRETRWWEWRAPVQWRCLPMCGNHLVEQLGQKFSSLEVRGGGPVWRPKLSVQLGSSQHSAPTPTPTLLPQLPPRVAAATAGEADSPQLVASPQPSPSLGLGAYSLQPTAVPPPGADGPQPPWQGMATEILGHPKTSATPSHRSCIRRQPRETGVLLEPSLVTPGPA